LKYEKKSNPKIEKLPEPVFLEELKIDSLERGKYYSFWVPIVIDPMGLPLSVPVLIAR
jgi:hypothetical protein